MTIEQLVVPRVDEREWVRLQEELVYNFARPLKMSRWQYLDTLPKYTPQPGEYKGRFDNLVLAQPPQPEKGLSFEKILEIVGFFSYYNEVLQMVDWQGDKGGFKTPSIPYATWLEDGTRNLNVKPMDVRKNLSKDERGGTGVDGVFLYVADRGVLRRHHLDLPGSQISSDVAPVLDLLDGGPQLRCDFIDQASPYYGSVVAGRKIVTRSHRNLLKI